MPAGWMLSCYPQITLSSIDEGFCCLISQLALRHPAWESFALAAMTPLVSCYTKLVGRWRSTDATAGLAHCDIGPAEECRYFTSKTIVSYRNAAVPMAREE